MAYVSRGVEIRGLPAGAGGGAGLEEVLEKGGTVQSWLEHTAAYPPILGPGLCAVGLGGSSRRR